MTNVQHLLDSHGLPPNEVCLDWAYQLLSLARDSELPVSACWETVQVDNAGQLSLSSNRSAQGQSLADLAQQLLEWSMASLKQNGLQDNYSQQAQPSFEHIQTLTELLKEWPFDNSLSQTGMSPSAKSDLREIATAPIDTSSQLSPPSENSSNRARSASAKKASSRQQSRLLFFGIATVLAATSAMTIYLWPRSSPVAEQTIGGISKPVDADSTEPTEVGMEPTGSSNAEITNLATKADQDSTEDDLLEIKPSSIDRSVTDPLNGLSALQFDRSATIVQNNSSDNTTVPTEATETTSTPSAETALPSVIGSINDSAIDQSVESMLAEAAKADPKVNSLIAESEAPGILSLPVQFLDIESMLQVQEFTTKTRIRQPKWQLRIATTDEFTVDPAEMQGLEEKQTIRWTLSAKNLQSRKDQEPTKIVVFAQLAGRRADIKWKIVAGCDDLPNIVVPLNIERLDMMLTSLQSYQLRLSSSVASIKESMELPSFPREQKSMLSAQRKALDRESVMVSRARQIIADATLFVGWMDKSLEVHGNLIDQFGNQEKKLLQIGEPKLSKSTEPPESTSEKSSDAVSP